jgi:hypothetical protein
MPTHRIAVVGALLVALACAGPTPAGTVDPTGQWEKREATLPPVSLSILRIANDLRVVLRLSGVEDRGRVALDDGNGLIITFESGRQPLTGRFESPSRLILRFSESHSETLYRRR